jgi:hypothetical protein
VIGLTPPPWERPVDANGAWAVRAEPSPPTLCLYPERDATDGRASTWSRGFESAPLSSKPSVYRGDAHNLLFMFVPAGEDLARWVRIDLTGHHSNLSEALVTLIR